MPELAYVNGEILPIDQAKIPIEDRGYQFGDAVYEVIAGINGRLFALEEHLDRLERSMGELAFPKMQREKIKGEIENLFAKAGYADATVYVQISRGVAPRSHAFPEEPVPQFVMTVRETTNLDEEKWKKGVAVITMEDIRWGRCDIKTVQLLPNAMAKQKALDAGVYDAILVSREGVVREASSANVFIVKDGVAWTHPLTNNLLPGITRKILLSICREIGQPVKERFFSKDELYAADEVFLTGTTTEVLSVVQVDGKTIGTGVPGKVALRLYEEMRKRAG